MKRIVLFVVYEQNIYKKNQVLWLQKKFECIIINNVCILNRGVTVIVKRWIQGLIISIFCIILYCCTLPAFAGDLGTKGRVLFISSYSYSWDTVQMQIDGIKETLGPGYEIDYEYMDTKRVDDAKAMQLFYDRLKYSMSKVEPYDVIIVGDDAALSFVLEYRPGLFKNIPIVFEGINDEELVEKALEDPLITGIVEKLPLEENLELAMKLLPDANQVVAILDDTITGEAERKRFYSYEEQYPELEFSELNASELGTLELQRGLRCLEKNKTILLFVVMTQDADGKQYTSQQLANFMLTYSSVPAFRMVEAGIGDGFLGGEVVSMKLCGQEAAQMAMRIIDGEEVSEIAPLMESPSIRILDEKIMNRYGVSLKNVPKGTELMNHTESFAERNQEAMILIIILVVMIVAVIIGAAWDGYKKHRMVAELNNTKNILENASQHDFLTGLPNRSKFMQDLEQLIESKTPCTVIMIDIDDFKDINDNYGHAAGDIALKTIADRTKDIRSQILTPYRFAGDEFIMILCSEQQKLVEKVAYDCRNIFTKEVKFKNKKYRVTGSIGLASYPKDAVEIETLITCADDAMYQVKRSGKNQFAYYDASKASKKTEKHD